MWVPDLVAALFLVAHAALAAAAGVGTLFGLIEGGLAVVLAFLAGVLWVRRFDERRRGR
jgi:hypothetical protein